MSDEPDLLPGRDGNFALIFNKTAFEDDVLWKVFRVYGQVKRLHHYQAYTFVRYEKKSEAETCLRALEKSHDFSNIRPAKLTAKSVKHAQLKRALPLPSILNGSHNPQDNHQTCHHGPRPQSTLDFGTGQLPNVGSSGQQSGSERLANINSQESQCTVNTDLSNQNHSGPKSIDKKFKRKIITSYRPAIDDVDNEVGLAFMHSNPDWCTGFIVIEEVWETFCLNSEPFKVVISHFGKSWPKSVIEMMCRDADPIYISPFQDCSPTDEKIPWCVIYLRTEEDSRLLTLLNGYTYDGCTLKVSRLETVLKRGKQKLAAHSSKN